MEHFFRFGSDAHRKHRICHTPQAVQSSLVIDRRRMVDRMDRIRTGVCVVVPCEKEPQIGIESGRPDFLYAIMLDYE